jgi:hypothetical protein
MPTKEELRERLKMRIGSAKIARLPAEIKSEKLEKMKEGLTEILKPSGMTADEFLEKIAGSNKKPIQKKNKDVESPQF